MVTRGGRPQDGTMSRTLLPALLPGLLLPALTAAEPSLTVDWPAFMARQDPVWERMPTDYYQGPFVGNGLVGAIVFEEPGKPGTLRFEIGRTDVYDHRPEGPAFHHRCRLPIGQLLLTPVGKVTGLRLRTDLWNAEVTGTVTTDAGSLGLRLYAPSGGPAVILDLAPTAGEAAAAVAFRPQQGDSPRFTVEPKRDKNFTYTPNPPFTVERQGDAEVIVQPLKAGSDYATAWASDARAEGRRQVVVTVANRRAAGLVPPTGSGADALRQLAAVRAEDPAARETAHRAWWHAYYPASFLTVPDARIASFYWQQLYKMASATRPDQPVVDLMGPWFKPTVWPCYWQNLNTQLAYYTTNVTNHTAFNEPLNRLLVDRTADLIANVPKEWRADSAALGRVSGFGELHSPAPGPAKPNPKQPYQFLALPWLMHQFYLHTRFTADDARLKAEVVPLLVRAMNVYLHTLVKGEDGRWHVPMSYSDEYGEAEDTTMNLAIIRWGFQTLIETTDRLGMAHPDRTRWQDVLDHLVDLPVDPATGIMIGRNEPFAKSHRHSSHLFAFYPFQVLHPERDPTSRPLLEQSLRHFTALVGDECLFKFTAASSLWATIGNGDEALTWLNRSLEVLPTGPTLTANTLYSENGWPTFESPISAARSITDFLLQSRTGVIHVLPAVPSAWKDVAFHDLRAEGAFLVSAVRRDGRTAFVRLTSLAGEPCRVRCDLPAPVRILGQATTLTPDAAGILTVPVAKGQTVVLVSGEAVPDLSIAPLPTAEGPTWGLPGR